jgi:hypothetical protein
MITTQVAISSKQEDCFVFEHPSSGDNRLPVFNGIALSSITGCQIVNSHEFDGTFIWEVLIFFAPADLFAGLFEDRNLARFVQRHCKQDSRLVADDKYGRGVLLQDYCIVLPSGVYQIVLKPVDLSKVCGNESLYDTAAALGCPMNSKNKMDEYKKNMLVPYRNNLLFEDFLRYSKNDACILFDIREKAKERNSMVFKTHSLSAPEKEILTTGSLLSALDISYIEKYIGDYKAWELIHKNKGRDKGDLVDLLKQASVEHFAGEKGSKAFLALLQGGIAKNMFPTIVKDEGAIFDADLSGAYASIQMLVNYPVGIPHTYGLDDTVKGARLTLGQFLKKNESQLVDRTWVVVVTGKLNHHQTLVPSKICTSIKINNEDGEPKIDADVRLYTNEIFNGVITSDILEVIRNVCPSKQSEYKSWMNLEITAAAWYPLSHRCDTPEDWYDKSSKLTNDISEIIKKDGTVITQDNRSRYWIEVPIKGLLEPFVKNRANLKTEQKQYEKGTTKWNDLQAKQQAMKLVLNGNYGVLGSELNIGNVVTANNITAACRVSVWCMAVALRLRLVITDGGHYNANEVLFYKRSKPSMDTLSRIRDVSLLSVDQRKNLLLKPLASETEWTISQAVNPTESILSNGSTTYQAMAENWKDIDLLAMKHVRSFFNTDEGNRISILEEVSISHKDIYVKAITHSQTNYQFHHVSGDVKTKARGHKVKSDYLDKDGNIEGSNISELFTGLDDRPSKIPPFRKQYLPEILKVNKANDMLISKTDNIYKTNDLLAGDSILKQSWIRPISLSMFHWQTHKQYLAWEKSTERIKSSTGYGLEQYFIDDEGSTDYQRAVETIQNRIDNGDTWAVKVTDKAKYKEMAIHPYFD